MCGSELQQRRHQHSVRTVLKRGLSIIVQLAEAWTFGYCAQYKYSQPFAETVCGSELQQRRNQHSVGTTVLKRGLSVIMLSINTENHLLKLYGSELQQRRHRHSVRTPGRNVDFRLLCLV